MFIILISFLLGMVLSGIWFGMTFLLKILFDRINFTKFSRFSGTIAAIIPTIVILNLNHCYFLNLQSIWNWRSWLGTFGVALVTAFLISNNDVKNLPQGKELFVYGMDGVLMEIPQRLMMQSFVWYFLAQFDIRYSLYIGVVINALIWCMSILIQNFIFKIKFNIRVLWELAASAFFSVGIGYILGKTLFILYPMAAHFSERIISTLFRKKRKVEV